MCEFHHEEQRKMDVKSKLCLSMDLGMFLTKSMPLLLYELAKNKPKCMKD